MFRPHKAIIMQISTGGNHHTARTHASLLPCCFCMSSYLRNVRLHFPHAIFCTAFMLCSLCAVFLGQERTYFQHRSNNFNIKGLGSGTSSSTVCISICLTSLTLRTFNNRIVLPPIQNVGICKQITILILH
jgi:hypothetical protein